MFFPPMIGLGSVALVSVMLVIAVRSDSLARNRTVGIRTRYTLRSDHAWDAGQRSSLPYLRATAVIAAAHIVGLLVVELTGPLEVLGNALSLSGFGLILVLALLAWRSADRAARAVIAQELASPETSPPQLS